MHQNEITPLTDFDKYFAQTLIDEKEPGMYELKDIYGEEWENIPKPTEFGKRFKLTCEKGKLRNIRYCRTKSNNHEKPTFPRYRLLIYIDPVAEVNPSVYNTPNVLREPVRNALFPNE